MCKGPVPITWNRLSVSTIDAWFQQATRNGARHESGASNENVSEVWSREPDEFDGVQTLRDSTGKRIGGGSGFAGISDAAGWSCSLPCLPGDQRT
jgi:hypothetical protein